MKALSTVRNEFTEKFQSSCLVGWSQPLWFNTTPRTRELNSLSRASFYWRNDRLALLSSILHFSCVVFTSRFAYCRLCGFVIRASRVDVGGILNSESFDL